MARDGSGNYTLPAGNPVVTGTTIDVSWANPTMADIATELTDSLSRSGKGGMLVGFPFADGTVSLPGLSFSSEVNSGFYRAATNDVRASIAGVDRTRWRADSANPFQIWNGSMWNSVLNAGSDATIGADWVFSGLLTIPVATVTAHEAALTIIEGQITGAAFSNWNAAFGWGNHAGLYELLDAAFTKNDEADTISAAWVFSGIVTLDAPVGVSGFGTGGKVKDGTDVARAIGFNVMPLYDIDVADIFDLAHSGMYWHNDGAATIAFTCDQDADIPIGATYTGTSDATAGVQTIIEGAGVTLKWFDGSGAVKTGTRTIAVSAVWSVYKYSLTEFHIWGLGIT